MFKLHEKSHLRLNLVFNDHARKNQTHAIVPMYFELQAVPTQSYHLPNEYYPTIDSMRYAIAEYYGFPLEMVSIDQDEYGDDRFCLQGKPYATVYWDYNQCC